MPLANADPFDQHVNDDAWILSRAYAEDLNGRLRRYAEKTGYGIYIVMLRDKREVRDLMPRLFVAEKLDTIWPAGAIVLVVAYENREARIATSENLNRKFAQAQTITEIEADLRRVASGNNWDRDYNIESAVEESVIRLNEALDPWFYVLEPTSTKGVWSHYRILPEIILFLFVPFASFMTAMILMALTTAGSYDWFGRVIVSSFAGCAVAIAAAFFFRLRGGILPGAVVYSVLAGCIVGTVVGALKPFWFNDKFTGKKSDAWWSGPVHFYRG
jgi:uncharacterized membrane protein YgcG